MDKFRFRVTNGFIDWDEDSIAVMQDCSCEHCGSLEPFTPVYADTCTTWCMDCAYANDYLTKEEIEIAIESSRAEKAGYFLEKYLEAIGGEAKITTIRVYDGGDLHRIEEWIADNAPSTETVVIDIVVRGE